MPTYVYKCDSCGAQFEKVQSFKDEPVKTCPSCASAVRRVFQPVGIVFKGSGWYITDSRKSSTATMSSEESKTESTSASNQENGASDASKTDTSKADTGKAESKTETTKPETSSAPASSSDTKTSANTSATA